jgi:hypothetical protein
MQAFDASTDGCVEARSLRTTRKQIKSPVNRSTYLYLKYLYDMGFCQLFKNYRTTIMRIQIRY